MAKKPAETKKAVKPTLEALVAVVEDFNSFMFDEGKGIDVELTTDELTDEITEAAEDLTADDTISPETAATLKLMGLKNVAQISADEADEADEAPPVPEKKKSGKKPAKKADPDPETEEEDNTEAKDNAHKCLLGLKKAKTLEDLRAVAKNNGIVCPPPFLKDIKKLREYVTTKLTAISDGTAPAKKKSGEKREKKESKRAHGVGNFIRGLMTESKKSWMMLDEEILEAAKKEFPNGETNLQNVVWYRYNVKKNGLIPTK